MKQTVEESGRFCVVIWMAFFFFLAFGKHSCSNNSNAMSPKEINDYGSH